MYRTEETESGRDIILDGFERGIASSPYAGIAKLINANITSVPGQASVAFKTAALNKPPMVTELAYTTNTTTDVITVASTSGWYNGMAIQLVTVVTSTGISTGRVYWIGDLTATTFKLYTNPSREATTVVDITGSNGSGTLSSYTLGKPIDDTIAYGADTTGDLNYYFILDDAGRAWWIDNTGGTLTNNLIYLGNDTLTGTTGRAIQVFKGHLIVFRTSSLDGLGLRVISSDIDLDSAYGSNATGGWAYGWESISSVDQTVRPTFVGQDDILYYGNSGRIASITETPGDSLDLDDGASWTEDTSALDLPDNDDAVSISELGQNLLIGGLQNKIYPWDRISDSFDFPIIVPENNIKRIISTNSIAYIFAGTGSRIYQTNGSIIDLFFEIPDHLSGVATPYYTLGDVEINRNQMYLSFAVTQNDGSTAVTGMDGVWAIDLSTLAFRKVLTSSHATEGKVHTIAKHVLSDTPPGEGLLVGWENASGGYGVDTGSSSPYSGGETVIDFDAIPSGTLDFPLTPAHFELKLSRALVSGESVQLLVRTTITGSYTAIGTLSTAGLFSASFKSPVDETQWLQVQAILTSTVNSPSFVPLREVRIKLQ